MKVTPFNNLRERGGRYQKYRVAGCRHVGYADIYEKSSQNRSMIREGERAIPAFLRGVVVKFEKGAVCSRLTGIGKSEVECWAVDNGRIYL